MGEHKSEGPLALFSCLIFPAILGDRTLLIVLSLVLLVLGLVFIRKVPPFCFWILPIGMLVLGLISVGSTGHIPYQILSRKLNLVWIPCVVFFSAVYSKKLFYYFFTRSIALFSALLLFNALLNFGWSHNTDFISYHGFADNFKYNAIYLSAYCCLGHFLYAQMWLSGTQRFAIADWVSWVFIFISIVFLSSKLIIVLSLLVPLVFLFFQPGQRFVKWMAASFVGVIMVCMSFLPVGQRFMYEFKETRAILERSHFDQSTYFTGTAIRLVLGKFSLQLLQDSQALLVGIGMDGMQPLLDAKILASGMYSGNGTPSDRGFVGYNAHNQYLTTLVESGLLGLALLMLVLWIMLRETIRNQNYALAFQVFLFVSLGLTENYLEVYYKGTYLFAAVYGWVWAFGQKSGDAIS